MSTAVTSSITSAQSPFVSPYLPAPSTPGQGTDFETQLQNIVSQQQPNPYLSPKAPSTKTPSPVTSLTTPVTSVDPPVTTPNPPEATTPDPAPPVSSKPADPAPTTPTQPPTSAVAASSWKDYVYGINPSNDYIGVIVAPKAAVPSGYKAGPYRHQLEGFNEAKFEPSHPQSMGMKYVAARVFEQFDVYSPTALDDAVKAFNDVGIPAQKVGEDMIDFGNGEGPIDVIRSGAYLDGDKEAGMGWQWGPVNESAEPMTFTMKGIPLPTIGGTPSPTPIDPIGPTPEPTPATGPVTGGAGTDEINVNSVQWLHANVSNWPVTSELNDVKIGESSITLDHSKAGKWPSKKFESIQVEGNAWVFVNRGGQWYGATWEWLRPGQTEKGVTSETIGPSTKVDPLKNWQPQPGEQVGFMVSTLARNSDRSSNERSNIQLVNWPG
ncbi:MAG: hypothetical protein U0Q12_13030 [Vicinamibacterales bacterium]